MNEQQKRDLSIQDLNLELAELEELEGLEDLERLGIFFELMGEENLSREELLAVLELHRKQLREKKIKLENTIFSEDEKLSLRQSLVKDELLNRGNTYRLIEFTNTPAERQQSLYIEFEKMEMEEKSWSANGRSIQIVTKAKKARSNIITLELNLNDLLKSELLTEEYRDLINEEIGEINEKMSEYLEISCYDREYDGGYNQLFQRFMLLSHDEDIERKNNCYVLFDFISKEQEASEIFLIAAMRRNIRFEIEENKRKEKKIEELNNFYFQRKENYEKIKYELEQKENCEKLEYQSTLGKKLVHYSIFSSILILPFIFFNRFFRK